MNKLGHELSSPAKCACVAEALDALSDFDPYMTTLRRKPGVESVESLSSSSSSAKGLDPENGTKVDNKHVSPVELTKLFP